MNESIEIQDIKRLVKQYEEDCLRFLQDLIRIPSPSGKEKAVAERILKEMERLSYDEAWIDEVGNVIGRMGASHKELNVLYDGHIDTVEVTDAGSWKHAPFGAETADGLLFGRGAADNKQATAVQVYGAMIAKKIWGLNIPVGVYVIGSVMEEDCDGLGIEFAIKESIKAKINAVVIGEATDCKIYRGHRGRVELLIKTSGKSAHASDPDRGENAVYKMSGVIKAVKELNERLGSDPFLGKGTIALTKIECDTGSLNCVPHECRIFIDRRLTKGEDKKLALSQLQSLTEINETRAEVAILNYEATTWTGRAVKAEKYFPTWTLSKDHPLVQAGCSAYHALFSQEAVIDKWIFSTNGVSTMGKLGIPTIGFGPGDEKFTHITDERIPVGELPVATTFYASLPYFLKQTL